MSVDRTSVGAGVAAVGLPTPAATAPAASRAASTAGLSSAVAQTAVQTTAPARPRAWLHCLVIAAVALAGAWSMPDQLGLLTRIAVMALLVLSLDLVVGIAGLATLGHAALFGAGAYAAGLTALHLSAEPLTGLAVGIACGAAVAALSALLLLRYHGFTFLMLTVAVAAIAQNLASRFREWTGGDDALSGFTMQPLLGWAFDFENRVAFGYALVVLLAGYYLARRLADSPFGLSVLGIHQCRPRMAALGTPIRARLFALYTVAGGLAGAAGALSAQTNGIVGLDSLGFTLSAEALVMLVLGGSGRLWGALLGTVLFMALHHWASSLNPYHWLFIVGGVLMLVVLAPPERLLRWLRRQRSGPSAGPLPSRSAIPSGDRATYPLTEGHQ